MGFTISKKLIIMKEQVLQKVLLIVKGNGNITSLLKDGFKYSQIAEFVNHIITENFVERNEKNSLEISEKGLQKLEELNSKHKRNNSNKWIVPDYKSRIEKLKENDVFLPNQNELFF